MRIFVGRLISFIAVILLASNYVYSANVSSKKITKCDNQLKFSKQVVTSTTNTFFEEDEEEQLENNFYVDYSSDSLKFNPVIYRILIQDKWVDISYFSFSSVPLWLKIRHLII